MIDSCVENSRLGYQLLQHVDWVVQDREAMNLFFDPAAPGVAVREAYC